MKMNHRGKFRLTISAVALSFSASLAAAELGIGRPGPDGNFRPLSENVKLYGGLDFAESCAYDATRDLIVVPNWGERLSSGTRNDGWVSLVNHDGSVHTFQWITSDATTGAFVNDPFGSDIANGVLYFADRVGGPGTGKPQTAVITMFDVSNGAWLGMHQVPDSTGFNDIAVAADGTIFASQTGSGDVPESWQIWAIKPDGSASVLVQGEPLARPNGVALDNDGNVVVVNMETGTGDAVAYSNAVLTFSPQGELLNTEHSVDGGDDGLVILADGTKYVSSVRFGSVSRIPPDGEAELIASGMPSGASMCYDAGARQLVVPQNNNNALAFIPLK